MANLIGRVITSSFKQFKVRNLIKLTNVMVETVTDITLHQTAIHDLENKMMVILNSIINKEKLINYDLGEVIRCKVI